MAQIRDLELLVKLIRKLHQKRIEADIRLLRAGEDSHTEVEILISPTEDVVTLSYLLAQLDLELSYDGEHLRVVEELKGLPEQRTRVPA